MFSWGSDPFIIRAQSQKPHLARLNQSAVHFAICSFTLEGVVEVEQAGVLVSLRFHENFGAVAVCGSLS